MILQFKNFSQGDSSICSKYYPVLKNKTQKWVDSGILNNFSSRPVKFNDKNANGKQVLVNCLIKTNFPFVFIYINVENVKVSSTSGLSSGLSINEIHKTINDKNYFSLFYPKESNDGFIDYEKLYRSTELDNFYSFNKTSLGNNLNQNHYIFGSQFTGLMAEQVQYLLGSTDIDIKYRFDWYETNGLYADSKNNIWLITLKNDTSNDILRNNCGIHVRELSLSSQSDNTVKIKSGVVTQPIQVNLVDGNGFDTNDTKILSLNEFYNGFPISSTQGWSFNKKGNKIRNITYKLNGSDLEYAVYEITITENIDNNIITLNASINVNETGSFRFHNYISLLSPKIGSIVESDYYPEFNNTLNNSQTKFNPLFQRYFNYSELEVLPFNKFKLPLITFFNEQDEVQNYYYQYEKILTEETIESTTGFTTLDDFYQTSYIKIGDLKIKNKTVSNYEYNFKLKHGIVINSDESNLMEDNLGDRNEEYQFSLDTGGTINNFAYRVINNLLSVDLRPYQNFYILNKVQEINSLIDSFQGLHNNYNDYFKNTDLSVVVNNSPIYTINYNLREQMLNINYWLNNNDIENEIYRLIEVLNIKDIDKISKSKELTIDFAPFLYEVDNNVLSVFENLDNTYLENIKDIINDINSDITDNLIVNQAYYNNLLKSFKDNIIYIKNITDISKTNKTTLNSLITNINIELETINTIFSSINTIIDNINTKISSLSDYFNKLGIYNNAIETYFNNHRVNYNGLDLNYKAQVLTYNTGSTKIYDKYYSSNKFYNGIFKQNTIIRNRKLTHFSIIFNYSTKNSLSVYNQTDSYDDFIYDGSTNKNIYNSNEFALYKQTETYVNDILTDSTDYLLIEEIKNFKRYNFTDINSSNIVVDIGLNYLDDSTTNLKYNETSFFNYKDLIQQGFSTISKTYSYYHADINDINIKINSYNINKTSNIKVFSNEIINVNTTLKDNLMLFPYNSNFNYVNNKDQYNLNYDYDGMIYFNFIKDANTFNYVVSKNIYGYKDIKKILTNISKYNIIDSNYVNFIGKPFDIE